MNGFVILGVSLVWHRQLLSATRLELDSKWPNFPPWHIHDVGVDLRSPTALKHISQGLRRFYQLVQAYLDDL